jgi:hypothetical protein
VILQIGGRRARDLPANAVAMAMPMTRWDVMAGYFDFAAMTSISKERPGSGQPRYRLHFGVAVSW